MASRKQSRSELPAFPGRVVLAQHRERDGIPRLRVIHSCKEQSVKTEELTQEKRSYTSSTSSTGAKCNATQTHNAHCQKENVNNFAQMC